MGPPQTRARAAGDRPQPIPGRRLRAAAYLARGPHPGRDGVLVEFYNREMVGFRVPRDVYIHVSGIDLIRGRDGTYYVLEDNLRTPSGISYVLENRDVLKRSFPRLFEKLSAVAGRRLPAPAAGRAAPLGATGHRRPRSSRCSRRASTTRPISNTPCSRAAWAWSSSKVAISSSSTTSCT